MIVFADTSALFALMVRDDAMHVRAKEDFRYFGENDVRLLTSSYVLVETVALLQRRVGPPAVSDFQMKIYPLLDVVWVDEEWHGRAMQRLAREGQDHSLVDCLSFEIMDSQDLDTAFAFDRHFADQGFKTGDVRRS